MLKCLRIGGERDEDLDLLKRAVEGRGMLERGARGEDLGSVGGKGAGQAMLTYPVSQVSAVVVTVHSWLRNLTHSERSNHRTAALTNTWLGGGVDRVSLMLDLDGQLDWRDRRFVQYGLSNTYHFALIHEIQQLITANTVPGSTKACHLECVRTRQIQNLHRNKTPSPAALSTQHAARTRSRRNRRGRWRAANNDRGWRAAAEVDPAAAATCASPCGRGPGAAISALEFGSPAAEARVPPCRRVSSSSPTRGESFPIWLLTLVNHFHVAKVPATKVVIALSPNPSPVSGGP
ncbi:hypothetical protein ACRRTK_019254 [Alexandromys fortis]